MDNDFFPNENNAVPKQPVSESPSANAPVVNPTSVMTFNESAPAGDYKKPRLIIAIITVVIFLAFIIAGTVLLVEDNQSSTYNYKKSSSYSNNYSNEDDYGNISYSSTVSTGSNYVYAYSEWTAYRFVPSYSGYYEFYTEGYYYDTVGKLCNSSGSQLEYDDDDGDGNNFYIEEYLSGGSTYYIYIKTNSGSGSVSLCIYAD